MKILLSSCSLIGFFLLVCKLNFRKKNDENFQSIFRVNVSKLKVRFAEEDKVKVKIIAGNKKMIAGVGLEPNHVWAPCCETWLKLKLKL